MRWRRARRERSQLGSGDRGIDLIGGRRRSGKHFQRQDFDGSALAVGLDDRAAMKNAARADMVLLYRRWLRLRRFDGGCLADGAEKTRAVIGCRSRRKAY